MFADVEADSWGLDPDGLRDVITERTRAVVPVHLYGYPARMNEIREICTEHDLFVLAQMERLPSLLERKRRVHAWYREVLDGIPVLRVHTGAPGTSPTHWMTSVTLDPNGTRSRDELIAALAERGIARRPTFPSVSALPMWAPPCRETPVAARVAQFGINLPSGVMLRREQTERVAAALRELLGGH